MKPDRQATKPLVVDLSNVLRDAALGPVFGVEAAWHRWERLKTALSREADLDLLHLRFVADSNLRELLAPSDRSNFDLMYRAGGLEVEAKADESILRWGLQGHVVVSNDNFTEFLRDSAFTSVSACRWRVEPSGMLLLERRSLAHLPSRLASRRGDREVMKFRGLSDDSPALLRKWICREPSCPADVVPFPDMRHTDARCPDCESYLVDSGPWRDPLWIKVKVEQGDEIREVLEDGDVLLVGRTDDGDVLGVGHLSPRGSASIDSKHLELRNERGRLKMKLLSANGARLKHAEPGIQRRFGPPVQVRVDSTLVLGVGDRLHLAASDIFIELSGRQLVG